MARRHFAIFALLGLTACSAISLPGPTPSPVAVAIVARDTLGIPVGGCVNAQDTGAGGLNPQAVDELATYPDGLVREGLAIGRTQDAFAAIGPGSALRRVSDVEVWLTVAGRFPTTFQYRIAGRLADGRPVWLAITTLQAC